MNKNIIFCFSGTGNSLQVAMFIAEKLKNTDIVLMKENTKGYDASQSECIGFILPVYYWDMPSFVKEYIKTISLNPNSYIFTVVTSGGLFVNTLNDLENTLNKKQSPLSYSNTLRTVASYVVEYEPFPKIETTLKKANYKLEKISDAIGCQKKNKPLKNNLFKEQLRKISRISSKGVNEKDQYFNISNACISCDLCEKICPVKNIKMKDGKPTFLHNCEQCMACIVYCPKSAINFKDKTQNRTKYHNPLISAAMMCEEKISF